MSTTISSVMAGRPGANAQRRLLLSHPSWPGSAGASIASESVSRPSIKRDAWKFVSLPKQPEQSRKTELMDGREFAALRSANPAMTGLGLGQALLGNNESVGWLDVKPNEARDHA